MKRFIFYFLVFLAIFQNSLAETENPRSEKTISILTSTPTTEQIYTAWGHTAIRVKIENGTDIVFNYGIFSFNNNFLYKFVKGETDYRLAISSFEDALEEARDEKNVFLFEQVLSLTDEEKDRIIAALFENHLPENRYYRYNFFFDNCSTRPAELIEKNINGTISYPEFNNTHTFRDLIYKKLSDSPWFAFGIDLCLGSETDRLVTGKELLFLPEELMKSYGRSIVEAGQNTRPLVSQTIILNYPKPGKDKKEASSLLSPLVIFWIFFLLIVAHTIFYNYHKKKDLWLDIALFFLYGLVGCIIFFVSFISEHPCTNPNYNLLWVNPLQFIFAILVLFPKIRKPLIFYHFINIALLLFALIGWNFIPQHYNSAFMPLILVLIIRSANYIYHYRK